MLIYLREMLLKQCPQAADHRKEQGRAPFSKKMPWIWQRSAAQSRRRQQQQQQHYGPSPRWHNFARLATDDEPSRPDFRRIIGSRPGSSQRGVSTRRHRGNYGSNAMRPVAQPGALNVIRQHATAWTIFLKAPPSVQQPPHQQQIVQEHQQQQQLNHPQQIQHPQHILQQQQQLQPILQQQQQQQPQHILQQQEPQQQQQQQQQTQPQQIEHQQQPALQQLPQINDDHQQQHDQQIQQHLLQILPQQIHQQQQNVFQLIPQLNDNQQEQQQMHQLQIQPQQIHQLTGQQVQHPGEIQQNGGEIIMDEMLVQSTSTGARGTGPNRRRSTPAPRRGRGGNAGGRQNSVRGRGSRNRPPSTSSSASPPAPPLARTPPPGLSHAQIAEIFPTIEVYEHISQEICSICQEQFEVGSLEATMTPCHHFFHFGCAREWFHRVGRCPNCLVDTLELYGTILRIQNADNETEF
ncbi:hypothetical protein niasHT_012757 [Heterodera trifolii]|uniref:RING-type E3 ubiquitin transferase n=1 Tax=Heterodera trifolii TaxID=157864 RepID=A0ABD2KXA3_9BILA